MNSQQSLLNQQLMGKKQTLQRQIMEQKQQLLLQQQMLADAVKCSPNSYCAYLLAQQREFISFHFYLLPCICVPLWHSNQGALTVREINSIHKELQGKKKKKNQLDLPGAGQLESTAPGLISPAQPRNVQNHHMGLGIRKKKLVLFHSAEGQKIGTKL